MIGVVVPAVLLVAFYTWLWKHPAPRQPRFTCPRCGMTSYNPSDIAQGYCGNCHDWTGTRDR